MQAFELVQLVSQQTSSNKPYLEFLRATDLPAPGAQGQVSMGLYLPAGGMDPQPALSLSKGPRTQRTRSITWSAGGEDQGWG